MTIWHQENKYLSVKISQNGATTIYLKSANVTFRMGAVALQEDNPVDLGHVWLRTDRSVCEEYPGHFSITPEGDALRVTLLGRENRPIGQFIIAPRLDDDWFELSILEIEETIPSLVFPPPIESESLVLPKGVGQWMRTPLSYPTRQFWVYPAHLNMRWIGGLNGAYSWIAIFTQGFAQSGTLIAQMSAAPAWLKSQGTWRDMPRTVRYHFQPGSYVQLAKTFRAYAQHHGLFRSLAEKIGEFPAADNLRGGSILSLMLADSTSRDRYEDMLCVVPPEIAQCEQPCLATDISFDRAALFIEQAKALGLKRGLVNIRGWIKGGYDESHPDIWPPEPALGRIDTLKQLLGEPDPILAVLHDNYQDMYCQSASYPQGIIETQAGEHLHGGVWAGGQSFILNSRHSLNYARRNWEQIATLNPRGMFIDTTTATQLYESYATGDTLTRDQDLANKIALLKFYKTRGQVLGSEEGQDFGLAWLDWIENRHRHIKNESIPLWPLVYHDAAFCYRYSSQATASDPGSPAWLADLLWGYGLLWGLRDHQDFSTFSDFTRTNAAVTAWHAQIGMDEMLDHRYLAEDIEQTTFTHGTITVNFANHPQTVQNITLPAYGYSSNAG
jgi:hypothetical protein